MRFLSIAMAAAGALSRVSFAQDQTEEPCGLVVKAYEAASNDPNPKLDAPLVYDCLRSVPFNSTAALIYINKVNLTLFQFQSTTAYLLDPPPSYQQPAVDLNAYMGMIKDKASNGTYKNQYDFELDVFGLVQSAHDGHFLIETPATEVFVFSPPLNFVSLSSDGTSIPQIYAFEDIFQTSYSNLDWEASPIHSINGQYALSYLSSWASQWVRGMIEDHGDWNRLMYNAAGEAHYSPSTWIATNFFTEEWLNITFANGTTFSKPFVARLSKAVDTTVASKITNGQDFYEYIVAAGPGASPVPAKELIDNLTAIATTTAAPTATPTQTNNKYASGWPEPQYPEPFLKQENFGPNDEGSDGNYASAYMISGDDIAVFSLPSFDMKSDQNVQNFINFTKSFIDETKKSGIKRVLFDLQTNPGGTANLAYEMYKLFFPAAKPWSGNRFRFQPLAEDLGKAWSSAWENSTAAGDGLIDLFGEMPWIAQYAINAKTGQHWAEWDELSDPYWDNGDWFMETSLEDLNNADVPIDGYGAEAYEANDPQPFAVENMAILTDGNCHSTCTILVELFNHQAGVKSVVVGGVPEVGPMQVTSGVRGSQVMELSPQVQSFIYLESVFPQYLDQPLPDLSSTGFSVSKGSYNLRDTIRVNETFPQQFAYHAASCRFFYTQETWSNFTALWQYAAAAAFGDDSKCVTGSTGQYSALNPYFTDVCGPNTTSCDLNSGVEKWGTSNATVFSFPDLGGDNGGTATTSQSSSPTGSSASKSSGGSSPPASSGSSVNASPTANSNKNPSPSTSGTAKPSASKSNSAAGLSVGTTALLAVVGLALMF